MKNNILTGLLCAVIAGTSVFFLFCGKSRSPLLKKAPIACAYIMEEGYFTDGKGQVMAGMLGETCKGITVYNFCRKDLKENFPNLKKDTRDYEKEYAFCQAKLGK